MPYTRTENVDMLATKAMRELHKRATDFDMFVFGYLKGATWADTPEEDITWNEHGGEFNMAMPDLCFTNRAVKRAKADCQRFLDSGARKVIETISGDHWESAGIDLWLTRQGHGAGFWDRPELYGHDESKELSDLAHRMGETGLYVINRVWLDFY